MGLLRLVLGGPGLLLPQLTHSPQAFQCFRRTTVERASGPHLCFIGIYYHTAGLKRGEGYQASTCPVVCERRTDISGSILSEGPCLTPACGQWALLLPAHLFLRCPAWGVPGCLIPISNWACHISHPPSPSSGATWDLQPEKLDFTQFHRKLRHTPKQPLPHIDREG